VSGGEFRPGVAMVPWPGLTQAEQAGLAEASRQQRPDPDALLPSVPRGDGFHPDAGKMPPPALMPVTVSNASPQLPASAEGALARAHAVLGHLAAAARQVQRDLEEAGWPGT
jgi:hypothetical protein